VLTDIELTGVVADDDGVGEEAVGPDTAPQRPLGRDHHGIRIDLEGRDADVWRADRMCDPDAASRSAAIPILPLTTFRRCVQRYGGDHKVKRFSCLDQYLCLAFAQLTWREIEACLRVQSSKLYHLGFRSAIARNTLANANAERDWRIYADFAEHLIGVARRLYADDPLSLDLASPVRMPWNSRAYYLDFR
jgi:hypothetical protein